MTQSLSLSFLTVTPDRALAGYFGLFHSSEPVFLYPSRGKRLRRDFFQSALIEAQHSMAPTCKGQIVRRDQRSQLMLAMQTRDQFKNHFRGASVEIAGRFIGEQELRLGDQRPGQRQALLLASRKFARTMMSARFQSYLAQPVRCLDGSGRQSLPTRQQWHGHIFERGKFRQQVMKLPYEADLAVAKLGSVVFGERIHLRVRAVYGTRRGTFKRSDDVQQGTLSRTRLPHDRQHLSFVHLERQILKEHQVGFA